MGRRASPRVLFGYFLHNAKSDNPFSHAGSSEVLQTSNQRTQTANSHNPIKSFCRLRRQFSAALPPFLVAAATFAAFRRLYSKEAISRRNVKKNSVAVTETARKSATGSAKNTAKVLSAKKFGKM